MTDKQIKGQTAEQMAIKYLCENDFIIMCTNWRHGHKELDIVAEKNNIIHIVEVRSLSSAFFMNPEQSISKIKQKNLIDAANGYMKRYKLTKEIQIDIISIIFNGINYTLEYLPNAIYPSF